MKIAFQGVHGAYSDAAARKMVGGAATTVPKKDFHDVFRAVQRGAADRGVIPIENSLSGSIHQNYDLLLHHPLHIVSETHLRIEHVLMCHPASSLRRLTTVRSHPQALAQCTRFLSRNRRLHAEPFFDTAGAAQYLKDSGALDCGAIASAYAARLYGLKILRRNLEDQPNNYTRFLLISRSPAVLRPGEAAKCSICFKPSENRVGILFRILGVFALRDIDLLKIESRPDRESSFAYQFYLDFSGNPHDRNIQNALDHLREMVREYRVLGAYPPDKGDVKS